MPGIMGVVLDRAEGSPEMRYVFSELTSSDITRYYEQHISSGIDELAEHLGFMYCATCDDIEDGDECPDCGGTSFED